MLVLYLFTSYLIFNKLWIFKGLQQRDVCLAVVYPFRVFMNSFSTIYLEESKSPK